MVIMTNRPDIAIDHVARSQTGVPPPMQSLANLLDQLPWSIVIIACLTLGLAPFVPEPHIWEKLKMLAAGTLAKPIDIFDLLMHATPFIIAGLKLAVPLAAAK